jgi:hypothetical protein
MNIKVPAGPDNQQQPDSAEQTCVVNLLPREKVRFEPEFGVLPFGAVPCQCGCQGFRQETTTSRIFAAERRSISRRRHD